MTLKSVFLAGTVISVAAGSAAFAGGVAPAAEPMVVATPAPAATPILGYVGITGGITDGTNDRDDDSDRVTSTGLEVLLGYDFGNGFRVALEGTLNHNSGGNDIVNDPIGDDHEIAAHLLYDLRDDITVGAFVSAGVGESNEGESDETYPFRAFGVQGSWMVTDQIVTYLQYAHVDNPDNNLSSGGYQSGHAARIGVGYEMNDNVSFVFDAQFGAADGYEDGDEDGIFRRISLGGDYMFGSSNWGLNYEFGHETYEARNDGNIVQTHFASIGFRYYFGDTRPSDLRSAGLVGTPDIMRRASLFTNGLD